MNPPSDYTYKDAFDYKTTTYTKVGDREVDDVDNTWDAGINVDVDSYVFLSPQPVSDSSGGVGEYPDSGSELINIEEYVFNDGTYVENII
jgi:hypothetical protein